MENNGYGIAVNASLRQYCKFFLKVHFLGLSYENFAEMDRWRGLDINWVVIPLKRSPLWLRFAKSILRPSPAITMRYAPFSRIVRSRVACWLEAARCSGRKVVIVYEDVPVAYFLSTLRSDWPEVPQAVRSHNITVKAFEGLDREGNLAERWGWKIELAKIRRFEKAVCESADRFWAITERPEAVEAGLAKLVGTCREKIVSEASRLLSDSQLYARMSNGRNPYGDGNASGRIIDILTSTL